MKEDKKTISSEILFAAIEEQLDLGRQAQFTVTGMSMWPWICHGRDYVIIDKTNKDDLRQGDIVLYHVSENHYVLHRITFLSSTFFQTTGDGNFHKDPPMPYEAIIAKAVKIVRKGHVINCNALHWRILSQFWMLLFPVRRQIFTVYFRFRKYI